MKKIRLLLFPVILLVFSCLYVATSRPFPCNVDCERFGTFDSAVYSRHSYVRHVYNQSQAYDTLFVAVDTTGLASMNWNLVADSLCVLANNAGLMGRVMKVQTYFVPRFNLAQTTCP